MVSQPSRSEQLDQILSGLKSGKTPVRKLHQFIRERNGTDADIPKLLSVLNYDFDKRSPSLLERFLKAVFQHDRSAAVRRGLMDTVRRLSSRDCSTDIIRTILAQSECPVTLLEYTYMFPRSTLYAALAKKVWGLAPHQKMACVGWTKISYGWEAVVKSESDVLRKRIEGVIDDAVGRLRLPLEKRDLPPEGNEMYIAWEVKIDATHAYDRQEQSGATIRHKTSGIAKGFKLCIWIQYPGESVWMGLMPSWRHYNSESPLKTEFRYPKGGVLTVVSERVSESGDAEKVLPPLALLPHVAALTSHLGQGGVEKRGPGFEAFVKLLASQQAIQNSPSSFHPYLREREAEAKEALDQHLALGA